MHKCAVPENVKSVNIIRLFSEGKPHYCRLCDNIIASFPNFKCHFATSHKGITLNVSAKCVICDREFSKPSGAGVHIKRVHQIGKHQSYPHSPSSVMSYVDTTVNISNTTPSARSRGLRSISLVNSPLSGVPICPPECITSNITYNDKSDSQYTPISRPFIQISPPHTPPSSHNSSPSLDVPPPILSDIDPDEDDILPPSPPRPSCSSSPYREPVADLLVALDGCTDLNGDAAPFIPPGQNPPIHNPLPPPTPDSNLCPSSETTVALSGCTGVDDTILSNTNHPSSPLQPTIPYNIDEVSPEPTVALSGCTGVDGDMDVRCTPTNPAVNTSDEIPFNPDPDVDNAPEFSTIWASKLSAVMDFESYSSVCENLAETVVNKGRSMSNKPTGAKRSPRPAVNRPNHRAPHPNRNRVRNHPLEARRIQTLFRLSKKRAARQILKENNIVYTGSKDQAHQHFSESFGPKFVNIDDVINSLNEHVPSVNQDPKLMEPFTSTEIKKKLKSMSNSAPGKDKVEYRHLSLVDPNCSLLQVLFNRCLIEKKIPHIWKHATTILIHKKGDSNDPSNFRPIALMSCIYKLFTSLLAMRVSTFAITNSLMSEDQKCARPAEGCHEHTFTLQSIVADCKRNNKNCFIAWLD